jgi:hypothetical protein
VNGRALVSTLAALLLALACADAAAGFGPFAGATGFECASTQVLPSKAGVMAECVRYCVDEPYGLARSSTPKDELCSASWHCLDLYLGEHAQIVRPVYSTPATDADVVSITPCAHTDTCSAGACGAPAGAAGVSSDAAGGGAP